MPVEMPQPDRRTPTAAENVYFELIGARLHTSRLADEIESSDAPSTAEVAQILDQCARLLGDLSRLASATPLATAPLVTERSADLINTLRTATGTYRDVVDRIPGQAAGEPSVMSVDEMAAVRDAASRSPQSSHQEETVKLTVELASDDVHELGRAASALGIGIAAFMKQASLSAARPPSPQP